jgi:hypothetical protein
MMETVRGDESKTNASIAGAAGPWIRGFANKTGRSAARALSAFDVFVDRN